MKVASLLIVAAAALTSLVVSAEDLKFVYSLGPMQNICFLQNIAENIQGKARLKVVLLFNLLMKLNTCYCYSHHRGDTTGLSELSNDGQ